MTTVNIRDIGPIDKLALPIPDEGGVVVLRGRNGCGKTEALEAVQSLLRGSGKLSVRDGQAVGEVRAGEAHISVGRSTRRSGELDVCHLEGKLDIGDLVDPGMKDEEAADARRIRALIALTGVKADLDRFAGILPGGRETLEKVVTARAMAETDLVAMAQRIKADLEAQARRLEDEAKKEEGTALGCEEAAGQVDPGVETDPEKLQAALEEAIAEQSRLRQAAGASAAAREQFESAQQELAWAKARGLPDLDACYQEQADAAAVLRDKIADEETAQRRVELATKALDKAQHERALAEQALAAVVAKRDDAEKTLRVVESLEETMRKLAQIEGPSQDALDKAADACNKARGAVEAGALARRAIEKARAAEGHYARAAELKSDAAGIRAAAKSTDHVLSEAVACRQVSVDGGRLVTTTTRGKTYFGDLSDGERWAIALDVAAERVGQGGLVVAPQHAWEGLDPANRAAVAEHAKALRVVVLTAEASDGDLRAEEA